ncbi:DNA-formamidopyrimidine glycosylase [Rivularia sp. UHCC 0363]|uniref:DNA-formamidopyrimidine glycosylase n=1 Tax=Rivularia sp. UHCC 0363 TaxID=3110244 RepID=UPI002B1FA070|nr:DNA-formamidopyrimidine glycosylase [Rivularia sp. UHCC 0363]MEA5596250.1 DNA-formamidopyrimidine glycosylase [Rivularia sp. UHCC 0363]
MPELPEVETVRRGLNQLTPKHKITGGDVLLDRTIAYPFSAEEFLNGIKEREIISWHRRGKYLIAELTSALEDKETRGQGDKVKNSSSSSLGVHLRMTGQLLWLDRDEPLHKHTRVRLFFGEEWELRFVDQRTFGQMWWVPPQVETQSIITGLAKLAADPFSTEFTVEYLANKLKNRRRAIKTALLDQSVVAGIGNIYADEALFLSGIRPETLCINLQVEQIERLHSSIIKVLQTSIEAGGTTFSNFLNVKGVNGNYAHVAWVYNRTGQPCRVCSHPIERIKLAGRSSHFCPQCQN